MLQRGVLARASWLPVAACLMQELTLQYCQASDASVAVASSFAPVFKQGCRASLAKNNDLAGGKTLGSTPHSVYSFSQILRAAA